MRPCGLMTNVAAALVILALVILPVPTARGEVLWYNGDWNGQLGPGYDKNYSTIEIGYSFGGLNSIYYDDFQVPAPGWVVQGLLTNVYNYGPIFSPQEVQWSIRSGCAPGIPVPGTLVAWGRAMAAAIPDPSLNLGYRLEMGGLNLYLDPGTYWASLTPISRPGSGNEMYILPTSGYNAVGNPPGNNDNSFGYLNVFITGGSHNGEWFVRATDVYTLSLFSEPPLPGPLDFSMGITGYVASGPPPLPLPPSAWLLGSGLLGLAGWRKFRKG